jgi:hypothetical protein
MKKQIPALLYSRNIKTVSTTDLKEARKICALLSKNFFVHNKVDTITNLNYNLTNRDNNDKHIY